MYTHKKLKISKQKTPILHQSTLPQRFQASKILERKKKNLFLHHPSVLLTLPQKKWLQRKHLKQKKNATKYGILRMQCAKRNIYLNLSDSKNRLKVTISIGYLKAKGKARKALYFLKKLAMAFTEKVVKSRIKKIHLILIGKRPRKQIRLFLNFFKSKKKVFQIVRCTRKLKLPHNGCRPRKMRRK